MGSRSPAQAGVQSEAEIGAVAPPGPRPSPGNRLLRFAGYAAVFGAPDKGGDIVRRGAFLRALARVGEVPLLWQHRPGAVIGRIEHLSEDKRGLRVIASVGDARASRLLGGGKVDGLSFGYRMREAKSARGLRELIELDLVEVSLVANPMQPQARVHAVVSMGMTRRRVPDQVRDDEERMRGSRVSAALFVCAREKIAWWK